MKELISRCVCGEKEFLRSTKFIGEPERPIGINECLSCGVKHQKIICSYKNYMSQYKEAYSCFEGKDGGQLVSEERYYHDFKLAEKRLENYEGLIADKSSLLDIGSGNGAFVHYMKSKGYKAKSLEFCENYKKDKIDFKGDLFEVNIRGLRFDVVTMHDVLEHFVDPFKALGKCYWLLEDKGILIIDFPNFFHPEGLHHWKYMEHLWMFSEYQLRRLLLECGFSIIEIKKPIPSKLVFYATKIQS